MHLRVSLPLFAKLLLVFSLPLGGTTQGDDHLGSELVTSALSPTFVTHAPGFDNLLFVAEREGRVRTFDLDANKYLSEPLLDLGDDVYVGGEAGLLGVAFHPQFAANGRVFVHYSADEAEDGSHTSYVRSYEVPDIGLGALEVDMASETTVLAIPQPDRRHNGGWIGFSPRDDYLYIATGDGGHANDTGDGHTPEIGNAQDTTDNLLGKILRIDVDEDAFPNDDNLNYKIPESNPFVGVSGDDEIWAYGLRNPWRNSFDRETGNLWIADVGQDTREEVNFQSADSEGGENYGWRIREGSVDRVTGDVGGVKPPGNVDPIHDYGHVPAPDGGWSVIGGYVYRGPVAELQGDYVFADFVTNQIWSLNYDGSVVTDFVNRTDDLAPTTGQLRGIVSFGEDAAGNLYMVRRTGQIFRVTGVEAIAEMLGDYNANGIIDAADYNVWRDTFGQQGPGLAADGNGDGVVNVSDYNIWRDGFEEVSEGVDLPEPATGGALLCALVLCWTAARRRRGCPT